MSNYPKKSSACAFTLVETVVVVGLFLVVMLALAALYVNFNKLYTYQQTFSDTAGSAGNVVNEMEKIVLPADAVLPSHTFSIGNYSTGAQTLVVEIPSIDASGIVITTKYDYAVIYKSGANMYSRIDPDASSSRAARTKLLSSTISSLTFLYPSADYTQATYVGVTITTQAIVKGAPVTAHLEDRLYLRNK
jgi:hypothetical protein